MDVLLLVEKGSQLTRVVRLKRAQTTIGRRHGCDLRIPSARVSRRHCILTSRNNSLTVEDLDSANGTFLNGVRVHGRQSVFPGDRLTVGPVTFLVQYEPAEAAGEALPMATEVVPVAEMVTIEEEEDWGEALLTLDEAEPPKKRRRKRPKPEGEEEDPTTLRLDEED